MQYSSIVRIFSSVVMLGLDPRIHAARHALTPNKKAGLRPAFSVSLPILVQDLA